MRVLTVNLWNGGADPFALAELVEREAPDVVAAQELASDAAEVLGSRLPHGWVEPAFDHTGRALVSRHPMPVTPLHLPGRAGLSGRVSADGEEVRVLGVHLTNPLDGLDAVGLRRRQVAALETVINAEPGRIVLCGDLNATSAWPAYRRLARSLVDAPLQAARRAGERPAATWSYRPWWRPVLRIDHVLVRGMVATAARVLPMPGSDHRVLVVDLVPAPAAAPVG